MGPNRFNLNTNLLLCRLEALVNEINSAYVVQPSIWSEGDHTESCVTLRYNDTFLGIYLFVSSICD